MNAMRETGSNGADRLKSSRARALRLAAVLLGIGLVLGTGPVRAEDDEEVDDRTFERKIMDNLMSGLGAKRIDDGGIDYRERSPLVVPSKIALPPPQTGKAKLAPNWPKDPDEAERKAARELANQKVKTPEEERMPLMPSELATRAPRGKTTRDTTTPGSNNSNSPIMMLPSELGYNGGLFNMFGGTKTETAPFAGEPDRTDLTQPPVGYQTPSPNFAYGAGALKAPIETCDAASGRCEKRWQ
jgi:hypothetical protein